jgi:hypothetical protein
MDRIIEFLCVVLTLGAAYGFFMMVRNGETYRNISKAAERIANHNRKCIEEGTMNLLINFDEALRSYDAYLFDVTAWTERKAYKDPKLYDYLVGEASLTDIENFPGWKVFGLF